MEESPCSQKPMSMQETPYKMMLFTSLEIVFMITKNIDLPPLEDTLGSKKAENSNLEVILLNFYAHAMTSPFSSFKHVESVNLCETEVNIVDG